MNIITTVIMCTLIFDVVCQDENELPTNFILNLPSNISIPENTEGGTRIFELMLENPFDVTYRYIFDPPDTDANFEVKTDSNSVYLRHGEKLDFEKRTHYSIEFVPYLSSNTTLGNHHQATAFRRKRTALFDVPKYILTITVTDVNEPPEFSKEDTYFFTIDEGPSGTVLKSIVYTVLDPDANDVISYSISSAPGPTLGKLPLYINPDSGIIQFSTDYDVDDNKMPSIIFFYVNAHDTSNLMDSALFVITIQDINDNAPSFQFTNYRIYIPYGLPINTNILNLTAIDKDRGSVILYRKEPKSSSTYFNVGLQGSVTLATALDTNQTQIVKVLAQDRDKLLGSTTVTISIITDGGAHLMSSTSSDVGSSHPSMSCCCQNDIKKLYWLMPLSTLIGTVILIILIIITRKTRKKDNFTKVHALSR